MYLNRGSAAKSSAAADEGVCRIASMEVGRGRELWLSVLKSVKKAPCAARTTLTELTDLECVFVVELPGHQIPWDIRRGMVGCKAGPLRQESPKPGEAEEGLQGE